jgi:hypothetical protein
MRMKKVNDELGAFPVRDKHVSRSAGRTSNVEFEHRSSCRGDEMRGSHEREEVEEWQSPKIADAPTSFAMREIHSLTLVAAVAQPRFCI